MLEVAFDISPAVKDENRRVRVRAAEFVPPLEESRACCWAKPRAAAAVRNIIISRTALMIKIEGHLLGLSNLFVDKKLLRFAQMHLDLVR